MLLHLTRQRLVGRKHHGATACLAPGLRHQQRDQALAGTGEQLNLAGIGSVCWSSAARMRQTQPAEQGRIRGTPPSRTPRAAPCNPQAPPGMSFMLWRSEDRGSSSSACESGSRLRRRRPRFRVEAQARVSFGNAPRGSAGAPTGTRLQGLAAAPLDPPAAPEPPAPEHGTKSLRDERPPSGPAPFSWVMHSVTCRRPRWSPFERPRRQCCAEASPAQPHRRAGSRRAAQLGR